MRSFSDHDSKTTVTDLQYINMNDLSLPVSPMPNKFFIETFPSSSLFFLFSGQSELQKRALVKMKVRGIAGKRKKDQFHLSEEPHNVRRHLLLFWWGRYYGVSL